MNKLSSHSPDVTAGQAIYNRAVLTIYDWWVLGLSNHYLWRCPTHLIGQQFGDFTGHNHLDVGVGTGYYLKHYLPEHCQQLSLMDLNPNSLAAARKAAPRSHVTLLQHNVFEPFAAQECFDSISINYLLHCLPGSLTEKGVVLANLAANLKAEGWLFGSTILGQGSISAKGIKLNKAAQSLMAIYNRKGIFSNQEDDIEQLTSQLNKHLKNVNIKIIGTVAIFSGQKY
ncbi:class I SAM-dependent methyltransferase [Vibrio sp.]|uniref:class I SAM-dependent methyltransferase n=1 Tax=Vibrio sp. TaxID=678 RepID=UPI003D11FE69